MDKLPTVAIIGPGKVGTAVGVLAARAGYSVIAVGGRRPERVEAAARRIGKDVRACETAEAAKSAKLVFLTVSDDAIEEVCRDLAKQKAFGDGAIVAHCSGSLASDVLAPARDGCGCAVGSMHPLQTFPTVDAAIAALQGTYCFYEGDEPALPVLAVLAKRLGMKPFRIPPAAKALYHASVVMACNYLIAIIDAAMLLAERAGIERSAAWPALEPIVTATLKNVGELGPAAALTGPISRGDVHTIIRHLQALDQADGRIAAIYRSMGRHTVDLAVRKGTITASKAKELLAALNRVDSP